MKITGLIFEKSAELERMLNKHDIPYNWDYNEGYLGCIDKMYDIEIENMAIRNMMINYNGSALSIIVNPRGFEYSSVTILPDQFKEVILS